MTSATYLLKEWISIIWDYVNPNSNWTKRRNLFFEMWVLVSESFFSYQTCAITFFFLSMYAEDFGKGIQRWPGPPFTQHLFTEGPCILGPFLVLKTKQRWRGKCGFMEMAFLMWVGRYEMRTFVYTLVEIIFIALFLPF